MKDKKIEALRATALFGQCSMKQLTLLGRVTDRVRIPEGRLIVQQDTVPTNLYILIDGSATVEVDGTYLTTLGAGSVIGELSLVDRGRATASVRAVDDLQAWVVAHRGFKTVWAEHPEMSETLLRSVVDRLRATNSLVGN